MIDSPTPLPVPPFAPMTLTSSRFTNGGIIPIAAALVGCGDGATNTSPDLQWSGAPAKTQSYMLTMYDPDAPTGSGFYHWLYFDIPATVMSLPSNAGVTNAIAGAQYGYTDYGFAQYGGMCPPVGDPPHRYIFTISALDIPAVPGATAGTTGAYLAFSIRGHVLARGTLTGVYGR